MIYITLLIVSFILLLYKQHLVSKDILSPLYIYVSFSLIYTLFPAFYIFFSEDYLNINLPNTVEQSISLVLVYTISINIVIFITFSFLSSSSRLVWLNFKNNLAYDHRMSLKFFYIIYPFILFAVFLFPWHKFGEETGPFHSIVAFVKIFTLLVFCNLMIGVRLGIVSRSNANITLLLMCVLSFVDTSRTTLFTAIFAYLYSINFSLIDALRKLLYLIAIFLFFIYLTLARNDIDFNLNLISWPFFVEGIFGSYSSLNAASMFDAGIVSFKNGLFFPIDLIYSVLPKFISELFAYNSVLADSLSSATAIGALDGNFSPLGGHFFIAEFIIYFATLGIFAYPVVFLIYLKIISLTKGVYRLYLISIFFMVVKSPTITIVKMSIVAGLLLLIFNFTYNFLVLAGTHETRIKHR